MPPLRDLDAFALAVDRNASDPSRRPRQSVAETLKEIRFHANLRYWQFEPCFDERFENRLVAWLNNSGLTLADQEKLLRLVPDLAFIDRDDLTTLYRTAFSEQISRWIMDEEHLDFRDTELVLNSKISDSMRMTWMCGLTDSLDIAKFHHANGLTPASHRTHWHTITKFGSPQAIKDYVRRLGIVRLVVLEDIVGSGTQACKILRRAITNYTPNMPLLFVPLIISESGLANVRSSFAPNSQVSVAPTFVVPDIVHVRPAPAAHEPEFVQNARSIVARTAHRFQKHVFGFKDTGSLIVLHTNCPNIAPAMLWRKKQAWSPLFPRIPRPNA